MKKKFFSALCLCAMIAGTASLLPLCAAAADADKAIVSPGLSVLAAETDMAMAGIRGNKITFSSEDFARALNLSKVTSITITRTPPSTDGELLVGSTVVNKGQTITGSNISLLSYSASSDSITSSSFSFRADGALYDMTCNLYLLDSLNRSPTLSMVPETSLNVSTHRNITLYGNLPAYDPDGDDVIIEIVSYPKSGLLKLSDKKTGEYTYIPGNDYTGKDSFTYVARDKYGNYSASATVNLTVSKPSTSVVYSDMTDSPSYNAALTMTEAGIMSGTQVGNTCCFYPQQTVSRAEFVVMAMNSLGISSVNNSDLSAFSDADDIPGNMKGYIAAAYKLGYVNGTYVDETLCFRPNSEITRAEAAVIVSRMINSATPTVTPVFNDTADIPTWAVSAVNSLNFMGILDADNGNISANAALTRADTAEILSAVMQITK